MDGEQLMLMMLAVWDTLCKKGSYAYDGSRLPRDGEQLMLMMLAVFHTLCKRGSYDNDGALCKGLRQLVLRMLAICGTDAHDASH